MKSSLTLILALVMLGSCKKHIKVQDDEIYSRHLKRKVKLTIVNTPLPQDRSDLNLLLLNDGQEIAQWKLQEVVDSLYQAGRIKPLLVVAIHTSDRMQEYGVTDRPDFAGRGKKAAYYDAFINDELYPFIKKKTGVRKFSTFIIAGASLGGLSAFDIAWNHPDKIEKVGVFSGSFWWRDKDTNDSSYSDDRNRIMLSKLKASRRKPTLKYWFYAGDVEESSDRDEDGIIDVIDDTRDIINWLELKKGSSDADIRFTEVKGGKHDWTYWSSALPEFLIWAVGK